MLEPSGRQHPPHRPAWSTALLVQWREQTKATSSPSFTYEKFLRPLHPVFRWYSLCPASPANAASLPPWCAPIPNASCTSSWWQSEPVVMSLRQIIPSGLGRVLLGEALATRVDPGGNFQVMNPFCWARIARPSESLAGFNCAYIAMISQVSLSSDLKPLLSVTSHDEITPVGSIVRRNATRPCSPRLSAPGG